MAKLQVTTVNAHSSCQDTLGHSFTSRKKPKIAAAIQTSFKLNNFRYNPRLLSLHPLCCHSRPSTITRHIPVVLSSYGKQACVQGHQSPL